MTTYTLTQDQLDLLTGVLERAGTTDDSEYKWDTHSKAKKMLCDLQPSTQEPRKDTVFGGPKAREQMLNQLVHPAPKDFDEPRLSDFFCGVDVTDGKLSVSVLRRRVDGVAEVLHSEQFELPQAKPLTVQEIEQILAQHDYELHGDRARYIVRMTEQAHGVKP